MAHRVENENEKWHIENGKWKIAHRVLNKHKARSIIQIQWNHKDNQMCPSPLSSQWLCGDMAAMS